MIVLQPFFRLLGRASVFWLTAFGLFIVSLTLYGLAQEDNPHVKQYVDVAFLAAFTVPACAGWLAGAVVQEFQHTSFGTLLPCVRLRIASGFLSAGLILTAIVVGSIAWNGEAPQNLPPLVVVAMAAYCFGGIFGDPLSNWMTTVNVVLALAIITNSGRVARIAEGHPWTTVLVAAGVGTFCLLRLFSRSTFRLKPFRATAPLPGRFSLERKQQYMEQRRIEAGFKKRGWSGGYLGCDMRRWVRAAKYELQGAYNWKDAAKMLNPLVWFVLLSMGSAWIDRGEIRFGKALAMSIYDALFRSPHQLEFGEKGGPFLFVAIAIAAAGIAKPLFAPVALQSTMAYPLSRRQHADLRFRGGLADGMLLLVAVGAVSFVVGHLAGWFAGYEIRFDFLPFFLRVLLISLVLLPLGRLRLLEASRAKSENTLVGVIFGFMGFVMLVLFWTFVSPRLFASQAVETATLLAALLISQLIYRQSVTSYYRIADLA